MLVTISLKAVGVSMSEIVLENIVYKECKEFPDYYVSYCGKIIRGKTKKHMKQVLHGNPPYLSIRTCTENIAKNTKVHRMIALVYVPNDDPVNKIQVNHIDGDKFNNSVSNLEWVTESQNQRHAIETGLKGKGSELYNAQLEEDQVHQICKFLIDGHLCKDLADRFGCSKDIIRKIKAGDTYFHIRQLYEVPHTYKHDYSESTIRWVCERILEGKSDKWLSENSTNKNLTIIECKRIRYKIRYKYISDEYF